MSQKIGNNPDYRGMFVFVESKSYNGEYVVVEQSPHAIHCIKAGARDAWDGSYLYSLPLVGDGRMTIISAERDDRNLREMVDTLRQVAGKPARGEKLQWSDSTYHSCGRNAEKLSRHLCDCGDAVVGVQASVQVKAPRDTLAEATVEQLTAALKARFAKGAAIEIKVAL